MFPELLWAGVVSTAGILHLPKNYPESFHKVEASCIRELWILEDGRFVEVSCVNTKYRSAYERFSTCYRTIHHIVRKRDWQDYPAEEVADAFEDISRYPFDGRPGVFYEV